MDRLIIFPHSGVSFRARSDPRVPHLLFLCVRGASSFSSVDSPTFMGGRKRFSLGHSGSLFLPSAVRSPKVGPEILSERARASLFSEFSLSRHRQHHIEYHARAPRNRRSRGRPRICAFDSVRWRKLEFS